VEKKRGEEQKARNDSYVDSPEVGTQRGPATHKSQSQIRAELAEYGANEGSKKKANREAVAPYLGADELKLAMHRRKVKKAAAKKKALKAGMADESQRKPVVIDDSEEEDYDDGNDSSQSANPESEEEETGVGRKGPKGGGKRLRALTPGEQVKEMMTKSVGRREKETAEAKELAASSLAASNQLLAAVNSLTQVVGALSQKLNN
jgi:hypothetical protein